MKKQRPSQHGGKSPTPGAKPAISQHTDDNGDFGPPIPSSATFTESSIKRALLAAEPVGDDSGSSSSACVTTSFDTPSNRTGQIVIDNGNGTFWVGEKFDMGASFKGSYPAVCSCCEYRQYLKGSYQVQAPGGDWKTVPQQLRWGVIIDPNTYNEDGTPGGLAYGYRNMVGLPDNYTPPPRTTGCSYWGHDEPAFTNLPKGYAFSAWLDFKGEIVDVCNGNKVVESKTWTVHLYGRI